MKWQSLNHPILFITLLLITSLYSTIYAQNCTPTDDLITGHIFNDYNGSSEQENNEPDMPQIVVQAFDDDGNQVGVDTTDNNGNYSLNLPNGTRIRLEFSNFPVNTYVGLENNNNNTKVRIIESPACAIDLALNQAEDYCQDDPRMMTSCFIQGWYEDHPDEDVLVSWDYNDSGVNPNSKVIENTNIDLGSVWGITHHRLTQNVLLASFMKRHASFGPSGAGAIYRKDMLADTVITFLDINAVLGADTVGVDPHPQGTDFLCDPNSWEPIGKRSFGDLELSTDQRTLYTVNLSTRDLYKINIDDFPATPTVADIEAYSIPSLLEVIGGHIVGVSDPNPTVNMRPFGLKFYQGLVYVGVVYTAESSQDVNDLFAYVYTFDPVNNTFNPTPVLQFPLNYPRGCAVHGCDNNDGDAEWNPWSPTFQFRNTSFGSEKIYPQPWLTDIEFSDEGNMIIGLRDRFGDQTGYRQMATDCGSTLYTGDAAGDILMACTTGLSNTWQIEDNGTCGTLVSNGGANTGDGPGGAEFFYLDHVLEDGEPFGAGVATHEETSLGGLLAIRGRGEIAQIVYDPYSIFEGGAAWYSTTDGSTNQLIQIYQNESTLTGGSSNPNEGVPFAKGGGLGDLEALCDAIPIEIGNYVWFDADEDGIQDPSEMALAGINVTLFSENGDSLTTVQTDANGLYYFNDNILATAGSSLTYDTNYFIALGTGTQFDTTDQILSDTLQLTLPNTGMGNDPNLNDSDATVADGVQASIDGLPYIPLNTGGMGAVIHDYDVGFLRFMPEPPCPPVNCLPIVINKVN